MRRRLRSRLLLAGLAASLLAVASDARAVVLYYLAFPSEVRAIDTVSGLDTPVLGLPGVDALDLSMGDGPGVLLAPRNDPDELIRIALAPPAYTTVGATVVPVNGMAYDQVRRIIYATEYNSLYTVNRVTGLATLVGSFSGPVAMWALGFDSTTDTLFGVDADTDALYAIDTTTGAAGVIGPTGVSRMTDIHADPATGTLYGITQLDRSVRALDKTTGQAGPVLATVTRSLPVGLAAPPPPVLLSVVFDGLLARSFALEPRDGARFAVELTWRTLSEDDTNYFRIERASNRSGGFVALDGVVDARGGGSTYSFTDSSAEQREGAGPFYRIIEYTSQGRGDGSPLIAAHPPATSVTGRATGTRRRR